MRHGHRLPGRRAAFGIFVFTLTISTAQARPQAEPRPALAELWSLLDQDGDKALGRYEAADAMLLLHEEADSDEDGRLSQAELAGFLVEREAERSAERRQWFVELDADGNQRLDREELSEELLALAERADPDGDGVIHLEELLAAEGLDNPALLLEGELLAFLSEVDQDGDGAFELGDLPPRDRRDFEDQFRELDVDGDARVSKDELFALIEEELEGAGFDVRGRRAFMNGVIGPTTPARVLELILEHPQVDTIVMQDVPGSLDDHANLRAARMLRRHGLNTVVDRNGMVASGGTDFFLAGVERRAEAGARFGIHSWGGFDESGDSVPRNHPEHRKYLDFYAEMGISASFYWYTLEAAPADDIHWMSDDELERYSVLSNGAAPTEEAGQAASTGDDDSQAGWLPEIPRGPDPLFGIDIEAAPDGIVPLPDRVDPRLRMHFDRYSKVVAANGQAIHILAQTGWRRAQIVRARKVLEHILRDAPGSRYGHDKSRVANAMAERRATLVLFDDEAAMERAFSGPLAEVELGFQDLRANECPTEGDADYMRHATRDAAFEEILHLVHDYGIRPALPDYDRELHLANLAMKKAGQWRGWPEDEPKNHRNEYFAAIYDNYLDLWTTPPTVYEGEPIEPDMLPSGSSHFGMYAHGSHEALKGNDKQGFELIESFFPEHLTYEAELPADFHGEFCLRLRNDLRYTNKSRHLAHVRANGTQPVILRGNRHANQLTGAAGDDVLEGWLGDDRLDGRGGDDQALFRGKRDEYEIRVDGDALEVRDRIADRDGSDRLRNIERLRFADMELSSEALRQG